MRRNPKNGNASRDAGKHRARRMFFETLESRQLLTVASPTDVGTFWETYPGNYVPPTQFKATAPNYLSAPSTASPLTVAVDYLRANATQYGIQSRDLDHYTVTNQYTDSHNGVTHIYLQQMYNGLPVADALASIHVSPTGRVLSAGINFVTGLPTPPQFSTPAPYISALTALGTIASLGGRSVNMSQLTTHNFGGTEQLTYYSGPGLNGFAAQAVSASLHYVPKPDGSLELAWKLGIRYSDSTHWFEGSIGTQFGGRVGQLIRLADYRKDASYNVLPYPLRDPLDGNFDVVVNPQDPTASPFGWHDINGFVGPEFYDTRGNNISAQDDIDDNDQGGLYGLPVAPLTLDFNTQVTLPLGAPATYREAATINAFYWANLAHDISFHYGFTEIAGNFQQENYTNLGMEDDPVRVDIQDSGALNNAFMFTPPDGQVGRLSLGISTSFVPNRDNALDNWTIIHEYTHGISDRLTGGPANASALVQLQSTGMAEGWSDWFGLMLTTDFTTDTANTPQVVSEWVDGPPGVGIRRFPYSFNLATNPLTLDDFNGIDPVSGIPNSESHNAGEIWASALWDLTWLLIQKHGFDPDFYNGDGGNNLVIQLVFDGMKLQPANPSFLEARDAILAADLALTGGANYTEIWTAFGRRGFGQLADDGPSAASSIVTQSFVVPPPLFGVSGTVYEDINNNNQINATDAPLSGWVIYADLNNNSTLDLGEPRTTSGADGTYSLALTTPGTVTIREEVQTGYQRILPSGGSFTLNVTQGSSFTGRNFLNRQAPGEITGIKFNDLDGNGTRDQGEPALAGVMIYVDINKDGRIGVLEPAAVTDASGVYRIVNVPVGSDHHVREVVQPGMVQTFPDPNDESTLGGAHIGVSVARGAVTSGINFGNNQQIDFGDAPNSYGTSLASNGPRHGVVLGYGLTLTPASASNVVDGPSVEAGGLPSPNATGDDVVNPNTNSVDDENGVLFLTGLTPSTPSVVSRATVRVGVRSTGFSAGVLQGWVDFNRDGDFLDAGEQIIKDLSLATGIHDIQFVVPQNALLGSTFARFRYGVERGIGPHGAALVGEVEDHVTDILQDAVIAVNDVFPDLTRVPPDPFIQLNSVNNVLNVLRNDFGSSVDPTPDIVDDFNDPGNTKPTSQGGTVTFQGPNLPLLYTPRPGFTGADTFSYTITATGSPTNSTATVTVNVSPSNPIAVDDIYQFNSGATGVDVFVLANDIASLNQQIRVKAGTVVSLTSPNPTSLIRSASGDRLVFSANGFTGTVKYQYTIEDNDPTTADSTAVVTIQVTPAPTTPAASHAAIFRTLYVPADANGNPIGGPTTSIDMSVSPYFLVRLLVQDPAGTPAGFPNTTGVESAYVDFLISEIQKANPLAALVVPVEEQDGTFNIQFASQFGLGQFESADFSTPGVVNEIGASHSATIPPAGLGNGEFLVMSVLFQALQNGRVVVQADHADSAQLPLALFDPAATPFPGPIQVADERIFIQPAQELVITGAAGSPEGEFTNLRNFFDVNADEIVNTIDILMIVNDLTLNGPRSLNQFAIALAGVLPEGFLDTNLDSIVNTLDILGIVNYLTARGAFVVPPGAEGEGSGDAFAGLAAEGEGGGATAFLAAAALAESAPAVDPAEMALAMLATEQNQSVEKEAPASDESEDEVVTLSTATASGGDSVANDDAPALGRKYRSRGDLDSEAADELYSRLSELRESLRSRRRGR